MNRNPLFLALLFGGILFFALFMGRLVAVEPPLVPLALLAVLFAGFIALVDPRAALVLLVFSMLLSPEIKVAEIPRRSVVLRVDDLILLTVFLVWMAKTSFTEGLGFFAETPINRPIALYTILCAASTLKAAFVGDISSVVRSSFYLLKYVEYFFLFIMVSNLVSRRGQVRNYLLAGAITAAIVVVYAYAHIGRVARLYAPFDYEAGDVGEPATLGGYFLIVLSLLVGLFTEANRGAVALGAMAALVLIFPPFVYTLSRASYAAYAVLLAAAVVLGRRRRLQLFCWVLLGWAAVAVFAPDLWHALVHRTKETFLNPVGQLSVGGYNVGIESSTQVRVESWTMALTRWLPERPLLGHGITGVGLVDAQYPLVLGETGLAGFAAFSWMIIALFRMTWRHYGAAKRSDDRALCFGFLMALVALCTQAVTTNTFVIVRIMEPFWFLAALVARLPKVWEGEIEEGALPPGAEAPRGPAAA